MSTEITEYLFAIGQRFKAERERLGFTQAQLGEKIDATSRTIGKYEIGETEARISQLLNFMKLGADINYILLGSRAGLVTGEPKASYQNAELDMILNAYAHADELGRAALVAVAAFAAKHN